MIFSQPKFVLIWFQIRCGKILKYIFITKKFGLFESETNSKILSQDPEKLGKKAFWVSSKCPFLLRVSFWRLAPPSPSVLPVPLSTNIKQLSHKIYDLSVSWKYLSNGSKIRRQPCRHSAAWSMTYCSIK